MRYKENFLGVDDYNGLRKSVGWIEISKEKAEIALDKSLYTVVAFNNDVVVGMGRLIGDGVYFSIVDVIVRPEYQGGGIGREIMQMIIDYVTRETEPGGRSSIQLISEKGKEAFYEKLGFKRIPHEFCGSGMRKVIHK